MSNETAPYRNQTEDNHSSAWDSLGEFNQNTPDSLNHYSILNHGLGLEEEESLLLKINQGEGSEPIQVMGRPFFGEMVVTMPVQRSDGTVERQGWMVLGMTERAVRDGYGGDEKIVKYYIAAKLGPDGRKVAKMISTDDQEALLNRLSEDDQSEQPASGDTIDSVEDHLNYKTPEQRRHRERVERIFKFPKPQGSDRFGNSLDTRLEITPESEEAAAWAFRFIGDQKIKEMIRASSGDKWREKEMPSVVRENDELRVELGLYLLSKFDDFETELRMPERIANNSTKNTSHRGYESNLTSQEYAALLAVSMLDGTFNPSRAIHDPIELEHGQAVLGQHRYAASLLLELNNLDKLNVKRLS